MTSLFAALLVLSAAQTPTVAPVPDPASAAAPAQAPAPPLSLDEALRLARANPQLAQAQAQIQQAGGNVGVALSAFLPSGSLGGKTGWTASSLGAVPSNLLYATYNINFSLNQTLWDFGRSLGTYLAAKDLERAARSSADATWNNVELAVRSAFYSVLATEALQKVADQTVASNQRQLDLATALFEVGQRPRFDVTTADVNLQQSVINRISAYDNVTLLRIALSQALGQDVSARPLETPVVPEDFELDVAFLTAEALQVRPDLKASEFSISAAEENLSAARSAWYPILGVGASYLWNNSRYPVAGGLPAPDSNSWNLLATLTWPFLNGGADMARIDIQKGALASARASRDLLTLQVRSDVESAVATAKEARARRSVARKLVVQAKENLELAEGRYQAGLGSIIDLTTSQTSYTQAQAQEVKAVFDLAAAWAALQHAVGK